MRESEPNWREAPPDSLDTPAGGASGAQNTEAVLVRRVGARWRWATCLALLAGFLGFLGFELGTLDREDAALSQTLDRHGSTLADFRRLAEETAVNAGAGSSFTTEERGRWIARLEARAVEAAGLVQPQAVVQRWLGHQPVPLPGRDEFAELWRSAVRALPAGQAPVPANADTPLAPPDATRAPRGEILKRLNQLTVSTAEVADRLVKGDSRLNQVYMATRQLMLIERIKRSVNLMEKGGVAALGAADRAGRDTVLLGEINNALLVGSPVLRIERVDDEAVRSFLQVAGRDFRALALEIENLMTAVTEDTPGAATQGDSAPGLLPDLGADPATAALSLPSVLQDLAEALAGIEKAVRADRRARWLSWTSWTWLLALTTGLALLFIVLLWRDQRALRKMQLVGGERWEAVQRERERAQSALLDAREERARLEKDMANGLWRLVDGNFGKPALDPKVHDEFAQALEALCNRLGFGLGDLRDAAGKMHGATALLGEAAGNLEAANSDTLRGLRDARSVGDLLSEGAKSLSGGFDGFRDAGRETGEVTEQGLSALAELDDHLDGAQDALSGVRAAIKVVGEAADGIRELFERSDDLSERARMLALNLSLQANQSQGPSTVQSSEELSRLAESAVQLGRIAGSVREAVQTDLDSALRQARRAQLAVEQLSSRGRRATDALTRAAERSRSGTLEMERFAALCREQEAELRRHINSLSELSARAEHGREGAARLTGAAMRLNELSRALEHRSAQLLSASHEGGTVVQLTAGSAPAEPSEREAQAAEPDSASEAQEISSDARFGREGPA